MPWARLDDSFWRNEKIKAVSNDSLAVYMLAISYSAGELTDGVIDAETLHILCFKRHVDEQAVAGDLVKAGLWHDRADGSYEIHDFLEYNKSREQVLKDRAESKERVEEWRERQRTYKERNAVTNTVTPPVTNSVGNLRPVPGPGPVPGPIPGSQETMAVAHAPAKKLPANAEQFEALGLEENGTLEGVTPTKRGIWNRHAKECATAGWSGEQIHEIATRWRKQYPDIPFTSAVCVKHGCRMLKVAATRASPNGKSNGTGTWGEFKTNGTGYSPANYAPRDSVEAWLNEHGKLVPWAPAGILAKNEGKYEVAE